MKNWTDGVTSLKNEWLKRKNHPIWTGNSSEPNLLSSRFQMLIFQGALHRLFPFLVWLSPGPHVIFRSNIHFGKRLRFVRGIIAHNAVGEAQHAKCSTVGLGFAVDVVFLCREKVQMTSFFFDLFWFGFVFFGFLFWFVSLLFQNPPVIPCFGSVFLNPQRLLFQEVFQGSESKIRRSSPSVWLED